MEKFQRCVVIKFDRSLERNLNNLHTRHNYKRKYRYYTPRQMGPFRGLPKLRRFDKRIYVVEISSSPGKTGTYICRWVCRIQVYEGKNMTFCTASLGHIAK